MLPAQHVVSTLNAARYHIELARAYRTGAWPATLGVGEALARYYGTKPMSRARLSHWHSNKAAGLTRLLLERHLWELSAQEATDREPRTT